MEEPPPFVNHVIWRYREDIPPAGGDHLIHNVSSRRTDHGHDRVKAFVVIPLVALPEISIVLGEQYQNIEARFGALATSLEDQQGE